MDMERRFAASAVVVVVLTTSWGVLTRYVLAQPAAWAGEIAMIAFAWVVFFGAAGCIKYHLHPRIDLLVQRLQAAGTALSEIPRRSTAKAGSPCTAG